MTPEEKEIVRGKLRRLRDRNGVRTLDPVEPAVSYETAYYREIVKPVEEISALIQEDLLPVLDALEREVSKGRILNSSVADMVAGPLLDRFERYANSFDDFALRTAGKMVDRNDEYQRRKFVQNINKVFGINISDHMSEDRVRAVLKNATKANTDLIVDLPKQYYKQINDIVFSTLTGKNDFRSLRDQLVQFDGINKRRAKLIAVDQTGKLIGKLNQVRQENEGITRYQWSASLDARTRKRHVENDGEVFDWTDDNPGKAFGRPGEEVRCRCVGRGVLDEAALNRRTPDQKSAIIDRRTGFDDPVPVPVPKRPKPVAAPVSPPRSLTMDEARKIYGEGVFQVAKGKTKIVPEVSVSPKMKRFVSPIDGSLVETFEEQRYYLVIQARKLEGFKDYGFEKLVYKSGKPVGMFSDAESARRFARVNPNCYISPIDGKQAQNPDTIWKRALERGSKYPITPTRENGLVLL